MSTDIPVILVAATGNYMGDAAADMLAFLDEKTPIDLVLLQEYPDGTTYDSIEWASVIVNSGDIDKGQFRRNAYNVISEHSNLVPIGVIEMNRRYEKQWDIPILRSWEQL